MKLRVAAVGRLRTGPELALWGVYARRFDRTGRALGLGPVTLVEVEDRKGGGAAAEAALLARAIPEGALPAPLDERGRLMSSRAFAAWLAAARDAGRSEVVFLIGGAEGLAPELRGGPGGGEALSFGPMVWPHALARVMLAEQLFRAASILAGTPYHRD